MEKYFQNELKELLREYQCSEQIVLLNMDESKDRKTREFWRGHYNVYNEIVLDLKRILKDVPPSPESKKGPMGICTNCGKASRFV